MTPIHDLDPVRQQAQRWAANLGAVAGGLPPQSPPAEPAVSRLAAVLGRLHRRSRAREHARRKLTAAEFMAGE